MITVEQIRELAANLDNVNLTLHVQDRLGLRNIPFADVINVLRHGEIIEQYPDDYPFPSCLELGLTINGEPLHVCVALGDNILKVITAYYPSLEKWEADFKTRRK